jgi:DNA-binding NarL/FixJ family response regulator
MLLFGRPEGSGREDPLNKSSSLARQDARPERLISVVLGDSDFMSCELLSAALKRFKVFEILKCFVTSSDGLQSIQHFSPDIILINSHLSDGPLSGFRVLQQLNSSKIKSRVVMIMDEQTERELAVDAFRSGVSGIFNKSSSYQHLKRCLTAVHEGQIWASNMDLQRILETLQKTHPLQCVNHRGELLLSKREQEIVPLVAEGLTNREISDRLGLSEHTVKNHLFRIYEKIGISSRVELILYATTRHHLK